MSELNWTSPSINTEEFLTRLIKAPVQTVRELNSNYLKYMGKKVTHLRLGEIAFFILCNHPDIKDRLDYAFCFPELTFEQQLAVWKKPLTKECLAQLLDVEEIEIIPCP